MGEAYKPKLYKEWENTRESLIDMYYTLSDNKKVHKFGDHLVSCGIYKHRCGFYHIQRSIFKSNEQKIRIDALRRYKKILNIYKEWLNEHPIE